MRRKSRCRWADNIKVMSKQRECGLGSNDLKYRGKVGYVLTR